MDFFCFDFFPVIYFTFRLFQSDVCSSAVELKDSNVWYAFAAEIEAIVVHFEVCILWAASESGILDLSISQSCRSVIQHSRALNRTIWVDPRITVPSFAGNSSELWKLGWIVVLVISIRQYQCTRVILWCNFPLFTTRKCSLRYFFFVMASGNLLPRTKTGCLTAIFFLYKNLFRAANSLKTVFVAWN